MGTIGPDFSSKYGNEFRPPWQWGIFRRRECSGILILGPETNMNHKARIYQTLKNLGFRETRWQYVYSGQIGGLIWNPRHGLIEHHIRFFEDDRIYVEIEFGRSTILHYLNHRMYLNNYLLAKIRNHISVEDVEYFCNAVAKYKQSSDNGWQEWGMKNRFYTPSVKSQIRFLTFFGDWRFLAGLMLFSFGVVSGASFNGTLLPILITVMIIIYLVAPKRI